MELKSIIKKVIKEYPKDPELKVEFYTDLPIGIADTLQDEKATDFNKLISFIEHIVADWNFADENGNKLAIKADTIKILGSDLATWIIQEATELVKPDEDKKKE